MQEVSELYRRLREDPGVWKEIRVEIAGEMYGEDRIVNLRTFGGLFSEGTLCVGSAVSKQISLVLRDPGNIPRMAELKPAYRLVKGEEVSEWVQKGVYYINVREPVDEERTLRISGFDAMMKSEVIWEPDQSLVFPMTQRAAALHIAGLMGVELENPEEIREDYIVDYPANEYTQRNILQFIAAAHGGNFTMTDAGALRLVRLNEATDETYIGELCSKVSTPPAFDPITKIVLLVDDTNYYEAGNETGRTLEVVCPYGTQSMAENLLAQLGGYVYQPVSAMETLVDPAAELGDAVVVAGALALFAQEDIVFDHLLTIDVEAPGEREMEQEYKFQTPMQQLNRKVASTYSLITKTAEEIRLEVAGFDGRIAAISVGLEEIESEVADAMGSFSKLQQTVNGFEASISNLESGQRASLKFGADGLIYSDNSGTVTINGNQIAANTVKVNSLYGSNVYFCDAYGNVAADIAVTGASSTAQQKAVLSSGAFEVRTYGGSVYLGSNTGPALLLGPGPGGGTPYCQLAGGPLVIGADSYGPISSRPSSGTYGQVYFVLE